MVEKHLETGDHELISASAVLDALYSLLKVLPQDLVLESNTSTHQLRKLRTQISLVLERLEKLLKEAEPVKIPTYVFDPADAQVVGQLIAVTLLKQSREPLASLAKFYGSGVYAIYYDGSFPTYAPLVGHETPIYVGKADPVVSNAKTAIEQGETLRKRLAHHAKTIRAAQNLDIEDFQVRFLVVRSAWQSTAEHYLIDRFRPIWNKETKICYGFGKHGDSAGTRKNTRSPWDTLHSGRKWATGPENISNKSSVGEIENRIAKHFIDFPPVNLA